MWLTLKQFYNSKEWIDFRLRIIADRGVTCSECKKLILEDKDLHIHHIIELTLMNVNDYNISLNPSNVKVVCHECHNKIHKRFGHQEHKERGVYIIYGPPCSGKTTYVLNHKQDEDIVIDMDRLYEAITLLPRYNKPDKLRYNVFALRNTLIDNIKTRYGGFNSAWIIGGYPNKYDRERLAKDLGAEVIHIQATEEECLDRLNNCNDYRQYYKSEWKKYIRKWFEDFVD